MNVDRKELLDQLDQVRPGLHEGGKTPQADCFLFKDGHVHTYNDEVLIRHPTAIDATGAVKGEPLYQLLSKLTDETLMFNGEDGAFQFTGKRAHASLNTDADIQSPFMGIKFPTAWKKLPSGFVDAIKFCTFSASTDMSRPALTCIHVNGDVVESCDNFRLTRFSMDKAIDKPLMFPAVSAALLSRYAVTTYGVGDPGWVHFAVGNGDGFVLSCRTSSEKFPDLVPLTKVKGASVKFPDGLLDTLNRAGVFTTTEFTQDSSIQITLSRGKLTVKSENLNGWYREQVPLKYDGAPLSFNVRPEFLKEMLPLLDHVTVGEASLLMQGDNFVHVVTLLREAPEEK